jgi:hypothetical protein
VGKYQRDHKSNVKDQEAHLQNSESTGLLFASGLITGEALIGILLAIPVAIYGTGDVLAIANREFGSIPGLIVVLGVCYALYHFASRAFTDKLE